jgi:choice-of-anchor B domain-containing protein
VTDKQDIISLARYEYPAGEYSHQATLSADRQYLFLDDEKDEDNLNISSTMHIIDVSDLENPFEATTFTNGLGAITHNHYCRGNFVYAANYSSGVRVYDVSDPLDPAEIAYFDTQPDDTGTNFNGLWSNFPYFPSGTVIGSDRSKGLFIWTPTFDTGSPADVNGDGFVGVDDLVAVISNWGPCPPPCPPDITGDGTVDVNDIVALFEAWE